MTRPVYTETFTVNGRTYTVLTTRSPEQWARYAHLCRLLGVTERDAAPDGYSERDHAEAMSRRDERNAREDAAALYGDGRNNGDRDVGR